jgi:integrase/recombinase XerD
VRRSSYHFGMASRASDPLNARFRSAIDSWLHSYSSENTRSSYRRDLNAFAIWCAGHDVSPFDTAATNLVAYRRSYESGGASPAAVARRVSAITGFFRHTDPAFVLPHDTRATGPRVDDSSTVALRPEEAEGVLVSLGRFGTRIDVLVAALLLDGLKLSEVLELDVEDVSGRPPDVFASVNRRGHTQTMRLDARTAAVLAAHLRRNRSGPLLTGESRGVTDPRRLTRFGADYLLKKAGRQAGLERPLTANALRRTYVTNAHSGGTTLDEIRHHLGQRDVRTTRRYLPETRAGDPSSPDTPPVDAVGSRRRPDQRR